jgi:hypothetical protein
MKYYLLMLPILIGGLLLTDPATSADQSPGGISNRWGITTKEPVEEEEAIKDEVEGKDVDTISNRKENLHDKKMPVRQKDQGVAEAEAKEVAGPENQTQENKSVEKNFAKEKKSGAIAAGKTKDIVKKEPGKKS